MYSFQQFKEGIDLQSGRYYICAQYDNGAYHVWVERNGETVRLETLGSRNDAIEAINTFLRQYN